MTHFMISERTKVEKNLDLTTTFVGFGSPGRARTADLMINSHPLYRLSYRGMRRNLKWILLIGQVYNGEYLINYSSQKHCSWSIAFRSVYLGPWPCSRRK
jgi:hypothetical protein